MEKKIHIFRRVPKYKRRILEIDVKLITQTYMTAHLSRC